MDLVTELHYWVDELAEVIENFEKGDVSDTIIPNSQLKSIYKLSKQLSDLCWQEIKRRKEQS